jgi:hypothetical protein
MMTSSGWKNWRLLKLQKKLHRLQPTQRRTIQGLLIQSVDPALHASRCRKICREKSSPISRRTPIAPITAVCKFGEDVSEQLERIPATYKVIRHVRPKFSCAACELVIEVPPLRRPIDNGLPGAGLLAAKVLISNVQPWLVGCYLLRWSMRSRSMFSPHRRSMLTIRWFRYLLLAMARPRPTGCGPMCTMIGQQDYQPPSGVVCLLGRLQGRTPSKTFEGFQGSPTSGKQHELGNNVSFEVSGRGGWFVGTRILLDVPIPSTR